MSSDFDKTAYKETITMMQMIQQGGAVLYVLIALNILGLALIFTKLFIYWSFKSNLEGHTLGVIEKLKSFGQEHLSLELLKDEVSRRIFSLEKGLGIIRMIASIAPLLGLLGTVWGIFLTFQVISKTGLDSPDLFAEGISSALITTVAGLVVAIPHVIGFQVLTGQLDHIEQELEDHVVASAFKGIK